MKRIIISLLPSLLLASASAVMAQTSNAQDTSADDKAHATGSGHTRGETARGQGSGIATPSKAEVKAEQRAKAREAKPHGHPSEATKGQTGRGEGSGIVGASKVENNAQKRAAAREAQPHTDTSQGGTPK